MGARLYVPILGRFLTVDPIKGGTQNDYVYPSDPIGSSDFSGNWIQIVIGIAAFSANVYFAIQDLNACAGGSALSCGSLAASAVTGGTASSLKGAGKIALKGAGNLPKMPSRVSKMGQIVDKNVNVSIMSVAGAQATSKSLGAAAVGRDVHRAFQDMQLIKGDGLVEYTLKNGKRPDYIDTTNRLILELKPNNPRAISLGNKQAQGYADEINNFGGLPGVASGPGTQPFTTEVITYTIK